jgi:hypothetical protein
MIDAVSSYGFIQARIIIGPRWRQPETRGETNGFDAPLTINGDFLLSLLPFRGSSVTASTQEEILR